jgi:hypothetical protein
VVELKLEGLKMRRTGLKPALGKSSIFKKYQT